MNDRRISKRCLLVLCAAALASCSSHKAPGPPVPTVKVVKASAQTVQPVISLAGIVAPLQNVALTGDLQEPADAVYVNEGDAVRRGQLLAHLNTADLTANAAQARAHLEQMGYQARLAITCVRCWSTDWIAMYP